MIRPGKREKEQDEAYATAEDFCRLFKASMDELYQLSFLLTADHQKAERCFEASLEDCLRSNRVFKEWARSWAKRTIIENAIRRSKPRPGLASSPAFNVAPRMGEVTDARRSHGKLKMVLALPQFERFVFVISVLERYSVHDSAILLGCSPREIREAQTRAFSQMGTSPRIVSREGSSERIQGISR